MEKVYVHGLASPRIEEGLLNWGLSQPLQVDLHWLDVTDWVRYKARRYDITKRQSTGQTVASLSPTLLVVSDCAQHTVASWTYRDINTAHSVVGRYLSQHQSSGTRFQTSSERRQRTLSGSCWRQYTVCISVPSALEVYTAITLCKSTFYLFTYLLTYLWRLVLYPIVVESAGINRS